MWLQGIMTYLFPRLFKHEWYSNTLCEWHYWLSAIGLLVMATDLTLAGVFQGYWWGSLQSWDVSTEGSFPFWVVRIYAGLAMFIGQLVFIYNIYMTWKLSRQAASTGAVAV